MTESELVELKANSVRREVPEEDGSRWAVYLNEFGFEVYREQLAEPALEE